MSEGTKFGEFKDDESFKPVATAAQASETDLSGTKMGEISEFEKSLYGDKSGVSASAGKSNSDDLDFQQAMAESVVDYQEGDIIKGVVRRVEKSGVLVDISFKSDGFISNSEFSSDPSVNPEDTVKPGDEVHVFIEKIESKEGYTILSRKRAEFVMAWNELVKLSKSREPITVHVFNKVQGGLVAGYSGVKGFIPASQVSGTTAELDQFLNRDLEVIVLQADRKRRKVIFSNKAAQQRPSKPDVDKLLETIEVGEIRDGKVTSIKEFGAFVDIGGVEGLVHISEISWSRVSHPSDILSVGQDVRVFVLGVDKENRKISLGMKQLQPDPWVQVAEKYEIGQVIEGKITRVTDFGAFIQIDDNLEGLIHISELSFEHVKNVSDVVKPGDIVKARIIKLIPDEQKIGLSLKGLDDSENTGSESSVAEELSSEAAE